MKISLTSTFVFALIAIAATAFSISAQDLTAEQLVAKHRDSIGTKDVLAAVKNQMVVSDVRCVFQGSTAVLNGKSLILSEGEISLWGMSFNSNDYPMERFGFDGKTVRIMKPLPSSSRSLLGEFLYSNTALLKGGLLGGTLSSSWALLTERKAKMSMEGKKTIDGKSAFVLSYSPKGGSDAIIKMYFDEKSFRHVRTEYTSVVSAAQGRTVDTSASQSSTIFKVVETFADFAKAGDLTLPRTYKITYARSGSASSASNQGTTRDVEFVFTVTNVNFNQELAADSFKIDA